MYFSLADWINLMSFSSDEVAARCSPVLLISPGRKYSWSLFDCFRGGIMYVLPRKSAFSVFLWRICVLFIWWSCSGGPARAANIASLAVHTTPLLWYTSMYVLLLLLLLLLHSHRVLLLISELFLPRLSPLGTEYAAAHRQHPAPATTLAHYHTCRLSPHTITLVDLENITTADFFTCRLSQLQNMSTL